MSERRETPASTSTAPTPAPTPAISPASRPSGPQPLQSGGSGGWSARLGPPLDPFDPARRPAERHAARFDALGAEQLDVLIIGGGITGAGIAREAARRGLRVGLVEQGDLAGGTSSRSSKLVHGGVRYLEQLAFGLVFESVSERRTLMRIAPHLVRPMPFLFPVFDSSRRGLFALDVGLWLYDALSLFRSPKLHRTHRAGRTSRLEPLLRREGLHGACVYYDCATDDGRLTLETALDAERHGAILLTHARAERLLRIDERMSGVRVRSELDPTRALDVATRTVVVAAGPWTDVVRNRPTPVLRPTKGVHIVVDAARLPLRQAVVMLHPRDGRVMFAVPWGDRAYVGTTDTDSLGDPNDVFATRDDVAYCLEAARWHFPDANLGEDDVISTWAALRPLLSQGDADHPSQTSREHAVLVDPDGLISIVGGKLTTYRRMAIDAVEAACAHLGRARGEAARAATATAPLLGGEGLDERGLAALEQELNELARGWLTVETARLFAATYGARAKEIALRVGAHRELGEPFCPGRPEAWIQVDWACEREQAETLCDVLMRRTTVFLRAEDQGLGCCEAVAGRMARILGWDGARLAKEINRYRAEVERSRRWREGPEPELDAAPVARG